jgi:hypothetical protein
MVFTVTLNFERPFTVRPLAAVGVRTFGEILLPHASPRQPILLPHTPFAL